MCGILGFEGKVGKEDLRSYSSVLKHRGPDAIGFFQDEHFSFVHWRLSIIDLTEQGGQPFYFKNWVLIFNGEIYNFREIAKTLISKGYQFSTQSDTEVLIKAFDCWKEKAVNHFIGMFAFAIYDRIQHDIYLFRDRAGVKPLYYSLQGGLSFGSELRVFKTLERDLTIDPVSLHQYFRFGYTPGERTIFREVRKLLPGQYLKYSGGIVSTETYWSTPLIHQQHLQQKDDEYAEELESLLISAFNYRMVADVPVGLFLSGGIDSSLVATLLQHHSGQNIKTFTIGFDHPNYDETVYAQQVADRLSTTHTTIKLGINEAQNLFNNFYEIYDEPFADTSGIPTALVSSLAKKHGAKVVLSADGADELFGGYPHYQQANQLNQLLSKLPAGLRKLSSSALKLFPPELRKQIIPLNIEHRLAALGELFSSLNPIAMYESRISNQAHLEINQLTGNNVQPVQLLNVSSSNFMEDMMYWDLKYFLPDDLLLKVDRATMFNSIEGREPFLDHRVVEFARKLPGSQKIRDHENKYILKKILYKYHPAALFNRPKQGFSIPIFSWFSQQLDGLFNDYLSNSVVKAVGILNDQTVANEVKKYNHNKKHGNQHNIEKMWRLLSFMMWYHRWMK